MPRGDQLHVRPIEQIEQTAARLRWHGPVTTRPFLAMVDEHRLVQKNRDWQLRRNRGFEPFKLVLFFGMTGVEQHCVKADDAPAAPIKRPIIRTDEIPPLCEPCVVEGLRRLDLDAIPDVVIAGHAYHLCGETRYPVSGEMQIIEASGAVHAQIASVHDQVSLLGFEPLGDSQVVLRKMQMAGRQMCIGHLNDTHGKPPRRRSLSKLNDRGMTAP